MRTSLLMLLLLVCTSTAWSAESSWIKVSGTITSFDGTPIRYAEVKDGDDWLPVTSGTFKVKRAVPGLIRLAITAADHESYTLEILATEAKDISVNVRLKPNVSLEPIIDVNITGEFNDFNFPTAPPMKRVNDHTFTYTLPVVDGRVVYQVLVNQDPINGASHSFNGTQYDELVNDKGGDFRSVIHSDKDSVVITFDVSKLPRSSQGAMVSYASPDLQRRADDIRVVNSLGSEFWQKISAIRSDQEQVQALSREAAALGESAFRAAMKMQPGIDRDLQFATAIASTAIISRMIPNHPHEWVEELLNAVPTMLPSNSLAWIFCHNADAFLWEKWSDPQMHMYLIEKAKAFPDERDHAWVLNSTIRWIGYIEPASPDLVELLKLLNDKYPNHGATKSANYKFSPDRKIQVGNALPTFTLAALHDGEPPVTNESIKGRYTLIDLWATWCGPCVGEMPNIHEAYEKFKDKNFQILSISLDQSPDKVDAFRKGRHAMPWLHAYSEGVFESKAAEVFEVSGIPKVLLVDPNGKIIRDESDLRGKRLLTTLEEVLGGG